MNKDFIEKIKLLRLKSGAGLISCKKALLDVGGDIDNALSYLKKHGLSSALNKVSRETKSGVVHLSITDDKKTAVILEVSCETDFVSKSAEFLFFVSELARKFLINNDFGSNFHVTHDDIISNVHMKNMILDVISKFGENIVIKNVNRFCVDRGFLYGYIHSTSSFGKVGTILHADERSLDYLDIVSDITMQIVAMSPNYLSVEDIPDNELLKEKELLLDFIKNKYPEKREDIVRKMLSGHMKKFYKENVLLEQSFIKDGNLVIKDLILDKFSLVKFVRFEI